MAEIIIDDFLKSELKIVNEEENANE
jgi:hypothetical protein